MIRRWLLAGAAGAFAALKMVVAFAGDAPLPSSAGCTIVHHAAYTSCVDRNLNIPKWVAYELTGPHTLGCVARSNAFHAEQSLPTLPTGTRATPADYAKSGYDMGHMAPDKDFAWDVGAEHDSFSLANMSPQLPGLNRQGWESLEEDVRSWAWKRGALWVYVGPITPMNPGPKRIGANGVAVPVAFWKVLVDEATGEALAFEMPQAAVSKGDVTPYLKTLAAVEADSGIVIPGTLTPSKVVWPVDATGWRAAKKSACGANAQ